MGTVVGTLTRISGQADKHQQAIIPNAREGSFSTQNTNNNDFKFAGMGKGRIAVMVNNAPNQAITVALYGMHSATGTVGDAGTVQIGSTLTIAQASKDYVVSDDPFPFYLVRLNHAVAPTDSPAVAVSIFVTVSAF